MGIETPVVLVSTPTGALIEALIPQPDDDEVVENPCVWCDGEGSAGGGADDEELYYNPGLLMTSCQACRGTGVSGTTTKGELRRKDYDDRIFFIDAHRAEKRAYDVCPDCGAGGCSEWCWQTDWGWTRGVADCFTGEEALIWGDSELRHDAVYRTDDPTVRVARDFDVSVEAWEENMKIAMRIISELGECNDENS